jgi:hypothetical protein
MLSIKQNEIGLVRLSASLHALLWIMNLTKDINDIKPPRLRVLKFSSVI